MIKFLSSLVITILLSSCAVEVEKLTENVGKYVPPNIDDTNFKNSVTTNKNFDETWNSVIDFVKKPALMNLLHNLNHKNILL